MERLYSKDINYKKNYKRNYFNLFFILIILTLLPVYGQGYNNYFNVRRPDSYYNNNNNNVRNTGENQPNRAHSSPVESEFGFMYLNPTIGRNNINGFNEQWNQNYNGNIQGPSTNYYTSRNFNSDNLNFENDINRYHRDITQGYNGDINSYYNYDFNSDISRNFNNDNLDFDNNMNGYEWDSEYNGPLTGYYNYEYHADNSGNINNQNSNNQNFDNQNSNSQNVNSKRDIPTYQPFNQASFGSHDNANLFFIKYGYYGNNYHGDGGYYGRRRNNNGRWLKNIENHYNPLNRKYSEEKSENIMKREKTNGRKTAKFVTEELLIEPIDCFPNEQNWQTFN